MEAPLCTFKFDLKKPCIILIFLRFSVKIFVFFSFKNKGAGWVKRIKYVERMHAQLSQTFETVLAASGDWRLQWKYWCFYAKLEAFSLGAAKWKLDEFQLFWVFFTDVHEMSPCLIGLFSNELQITWSQCFPLEKRFFSVRVVTSF